ncbi:MAG: GvpL/GvpF family gas vesicle protein [bacterium]
MEKMLYSILSVKADHGRLNILLSEMEGIAGSELHACLYEDLAAVFGDVEKSVLLADRSNAIEYARVVDALAQQFTLLPMRFGSVMESTEEMITMLGRNHDEFTQNLEKVRDKHEFGLKVFCDSDKMKAELQKKIVPAEPANAGAEPAVKNSVYRDYVDRKLKEHRFEELLVAYADSVIARITDDLARLNAVYKFKKMASDATVIDATFLLGKDMEDELILTVKHLQDELPALNFVLTGPWPPYNFVEITIK